MVRGKYMLHNLYTVRYNMHINKYTFTYIYLLIFHWLVHDVLHSVVSPETTTSRSKHMAWWKNSVNCVLSLQHGHFSYLLRFQRN
jgi:hypothetical protein